MERRVNGNFGENDFFQDSPAIQLSRSEIRLLPWLCRNLCLLYRQPVVGEKKVALVVGTEDGFFFPIFRLYLRG